jgi:drug/metabolite transporter (DMT)-like permease
MESSPVRNRLLVIAAALLFSTGGAAIKATTLTGWQVASFRSGVAAVVLLLALPEARRGWSWRTVLVAAAYASTLILFSLANRLTTAANAIFLQSAAPLFLLLLGPWLLREPIRRSDLLYILALTAGVALVFTGVEFAVATAPNPPRGNVLAGASALTYALALAGLRWVGRRQKGNPGIATVAVGNIVACVAALPMALSAPVAPAANVPVILYLGVVQIGLAYWCLTRAIRHVTAFEVSTFLVIEPAMSPVWTWLVHGERPGARALAGGAVILSATLVNTWRQSRAAPAK